LLGNFYESAHLGRPWYCLRARRAPGFAKVPREILDVIQLGSCALVRLAAAALFRAQKFAERASERRIQFVQYSKLFQFDDFSKNEFELPGTEVLPDLRDRYSNFPGVRLHAVNEAEQEGHLNLREARFSAVQRHYGPDGLHRNWAAHQVSHANQLKTAGSQRE